MRTGTANENKTSHYVYLIECQNGNFYTGYTTDPMRRYKEHVKGTSKSKYTRSFPPKRMAACWQVLDGKGSALKIEHKLKKLSKSHKKILSEDPCRLQNMLDVLIVDKV